MPKWIFLQRAIILFFLALILLTYFAALNHMISQKIAVDSTIFYLSGKNFWAHRPIYSAITQEYFHVVPYSYTTLSTAPQIDHGILKNLNPPVFTLLWLPLSIFSYGAATWIWNLLLLTSSVLSLWMLNKIAFPKSSIWSYFILLSLYLASAPAYTNIILGEVGSLSLLGTVSIWILAKKNSDAYAGVVLGALLSIKYFFIPIGLLFLLQKRWRLTLFAALSFTLLNLLALSLFGKASFMQYTKILYAVNWYLDPWNASLYGFLAKLSAYADQTKIIMAPWGKAAYLGIGASLIAYLAYAVNRPTKNTDYFDQWFIYALIISVWLCPLGWVYYLTLMILPSIFIFKHYAFAQEVKISSVFLFITLMGLLTVPISIYQSFIRYSTTAYVTYTGFFFGLLFLLGLWVHFFKTPQSTLHASKQQANPTFLLVWILLTYFIILLSFQVFCYAAWHALKH